MLLSQYCYICFYAVSEAFLQKEAKNKLRLTLFAYSNINIAAEEDVYHE